MSEQEVTADATSEVENNQNDTDASTSDETAGESALGDAGKQALDRMKERVKTAEKAARDAVAEAARIKAELANRDKPAEEQAIEAARAEAHAEATKRANERILKADLRAAATGKLADPNDAALYINLADFTVSEDGGTDSDALNEAITDLITRKPHLAAKQTRFDGTADQGAKGHEPRVQQLTKDDLTRMSPDEIVAAEAAGQLNQLKGIKS